MNYYYGTYQSSIVDSLQGLWFKVLGFLPNIVAAIIILILGWLIAIFLGKLVHRILVSIKVDHFADRLGLDLLSNRTGRKLTISGLGQWLVKWFILIAVFTAAAEILGLSEISSFLYGTVFPYFGNVIVAVAVLIVGMIAANFLADIVRGAVKSADLKGANAMAAITRWAIIIMAVLTALVQLKVDKTFISNLFTAVVAMFAIAGGLAFGLGGRDHAKKILDHIDREINS